ISESALLSLAIPNKISSLVGRRLDLLAPEERDILDVAAVEGTTFHSDTLGSILFAGQPRIGILKALRTLEKRHGLIRPDGGAYAFSNAKIREVLYEALSPELRTEYHRMVGEHLAATRGSEDDLSGVIAFQLVEGGLDERALPFLA